MRQHVALWLSFVFGASLASGADALDGQEFEQQVRERLEGIWRGDMTVVLQDQAKYLDPVRNITDGALALATVARTPIIFLGPGGAEAPSEMLRGAGIAPDDYKVVERGDGWFSLVFALDSPWLNNAKFRFQGDTLDMRVEEPGMFAATIPLRRIYRDSDWAIGAWACEDGDSFVVEDDGSTVPERACSIPVRRFDLAGGDDREVRAEGVALRRDGWDRAVLVRGGDEIPLRRAFQQREVFSGLYLPDSAALKESKHFQAMPADLQPNLMLEAFDLLAEEGRQPLDQFLAGEPAILSIRGTTIVLTTPGALWVVRVDGDVVWLDSGSSPPFPMRKIHD